MLSRALIRAAALAAATLLATAPARADEPTRASVAATGAFGSLLPEEHVYRLGLVGYSAPPTLYVGVSIDGRVTRSVHVEGSAGVEIALGVVLGTTLRYVPYERDGLSVSFGAGPLLSLGAAYGTEVFIRGDAGVRYVSPTTPVAIGLNVGFGLALNDAGTMWCGVDTCSSYIRRGDRLETAVASLGYVFGR